MKTPRLAAIDVGSNAVRLAVASFAPTGAIAEVQAQRFGLRLGADVFTQGYIGPPLLQKLCDIFVKIAENMQALNVSTYRAVATAAMREASNHKEVQRTLKATAGIELELIDGHEEGHLSYLALKAAAGKLPPSTLAFDLGGGSLEMGILPNPKPVSIPLGAVRLLERFPALRNPIDRDTYNHISSILVADIRDALPIIPHSNVAVSTGGSLRALATAMQAPTRGPSISVDMHTMRGFITELARQTIEERAKTHYLRADRADLVLPAGMVVDAIARVTGFKTCLIPDSGLREGVLLDLIQRPNVLESFFPVHFPKTTHEANALHAHIQDMYDYLSPIHKLWPPAWHMIQHALYHTHAIHTLNPYQQSVLDHIQYYAGMHTNEPSSLIDSRDLQAAEWVATLIWLAQHMAPSCSVKSIKYEGQNIKLTGCLPTGSEPLEIPNFLANAIGKKIELS